MSDEELIDDDVLIDAGAEYSAKSDFNKGAIVSDSFKKCMELRSKQMRPGYINTSRNKDGTISQNVVEDSRQAYISGVKYLSCLLAPEISQEKMNDKIKTLLDKEKTIFDELAYQMPRLEYEDKTKRFKIIRDGKKFMPQIDEMLPSNSIRMDNIGNKPVLEIVKGFWNPQVNAYWDSLVDIYDDLFALYSTLIGGNEVNYFKQKTSW